MCAASWGVGGPRACGEHASHMLGRFAPQSTHSVSRRETRAGGLLARACMSSGAIISAPRPALGPRGGSHRVEVSLGGRLRGGRGSRRPALGLCTRGWREREAGSQRAAREACRGVAARRRRRQEGRHPSRSERGREVRLEHRRRERRRERRSESRREGRRALGRLETRPGALDREVELGMKLLLHEVAHAPRRLDGPRRLQPRRRARAGEASDWRRRRGSIGHCRLARRFAGRFARLLCPRGEPHATRWRPSRRRLEAPCLCRGKRGGGGGGGDRGERGGGGGARDRGGKGGGGGGGGRGGGDGVAVCLDRGRKARAEGLQDGSGMRPRR
mmetsp:Transcript_26647/g.83452  ORF Transcript_26647/g.83452 Transcript_26647/m.83452 type:complete len:331 (-) Transcript_26647:281-1273(-)